MDEIISILNPDNTVTINRPLAHALGINEAIVYSALIAKQIYYERRGMLDADGYFYSTIDNLKESTSLSKRQQSSAIKALSEVGLISYRKRGMPARRGFKVIDNVDAINEFIQKGKTIMSSLNSVSQPCLLQNEPTSGNKNAQQVGTKCDDKSEQNAPYTYNLNNKSKDNNPNQSIFSDGIDRTDISWNERDEYLKIIRENIEYEYQTEKEKVDELVKIMLDIICSTKETVRVNGEELPHEVVKSRFLKINSTHIEYILDAMKKSASDVRNIRAYLITVLYNAPSTIDNFYSAWVNHDMNG